MIIDVFIAALVVSPYLDEIIAEMPALDNYEAIVLLVKKMIVRSYNHNITSLPYWLFIEDLSSLSIIH